MGATTPLGTNDQFPVGSTFTIQPGSTCAAPSVSGTGTATYSVPATGSCTVNYQVCAPAPNASVCDTATLTVTASAADMSAALGATTPTVVSPGQVISGLTATCTNVGANAATNATCVPTVSAGTISALSCAPTSPQASLAAGANIVCTYTYTAPGTAGGTDEPTTSVTFTATTGATNDSAAGNNVATQATPVIDAVNDTAGGQPGTTGTINVAANDQFPVGSVFTQTGTTCSSAGMMTSAGVVVFTNPAALTSCTISYQVCALAPSSTVCDSAVVVVTAGVAPFLTVTKTASQTPLAVAKAGQFYTITITVANGPTTAAMTIADTLPAGMTLSAAPTATGGVMTGCPTTGTNLTGCSIAAVTSGPVVITVPVNVGGAAAGTPAINSATVSGGGDPTCPAAAHCTGTVTSTVANPDMQVNPNTPLPPAVKDVPYPPNQTVTCTNASTVDAANAFCTVTDLPPGLISTCSPASPVALLPAGEKIVCTISGTPTVTVAIKAKVVTGADGDTVSTNNEGVLLSTVAALSVNKTVSANPLIIGAANQYYSISIAVINGPTIEPITLTDNFSAGITTSGPVTISGGSFKIGTCPAANAAGATSLSGCQIEAGVTGTVYISVPILVDESAEGPNGGNNIAIASGGGDPACPTSVSCIGSTGSVAVIYGDLGALFIRKLADRTTAEIGEVITYKLTVRSTKIKGAATVEDHLPAGFKLIGNTTRVSKGGVLTAAADPAGAPGPNLVFSIQIPAFEEDVEIEYKVRVGLGADRGDGINSAQASMVRGRLRSLIAKVKVKISGGVFTREACIVGKVYADCNGNAVQDKGEPGLLGVTLYLEDGTSMTTDDNGQYSICGVRAVTHVLKVDGKTLPKGAKLGITGNRNAGDPNTLFVDVLAGQLHNTEFRIDSCSPVLQQNLDTQKKGQNQTGAIVLPSGGVQFDSAKPKIPVGGLMPQPNTKAVETGSKQ